MEKPIGIEFMRLTRYENLDPSPQSREVPRPPVQLPLAEGSETLPLPEGKSLPLEKMDLADLVKRRETLRQYTEEAISLQELSFLLWGTQGVKSFSEKQLTRRTVPSAGARHPFETLLLVNRVESLEPGLYRYLALEHHLARVNAPEDIRERLTEACLKQGHVRSSAVTFAWVAVALRTVWRYSQRAYRYLHLDAGHVCQNLYLLAEAIGCGVCGIAAFNDELVNQALGVDGVEQFAIYLASLGRRIERP